MTKRPLLWTSIVAVSLLAPVAGAQQAAPRPAAEESDALTDKARQLFEEGVKSAKAGKWDAAHASFLAAWGLKAHYQIASNLGVACLKVGKPRDAAEYLTRYLREAPAEKVQERQRAEEALAEARAKVTTVTVQVAPEGAEVTIDGTTVGQAPLVDPVFLDPGKHAIGAKLDGYEPAERSIDATAGGTETVTFQLEREQAPRVVVRPLPGTEATPSRGGSGGRTAVLVGGGIATGVGAAAGVLFTVLANSKAREAEDLKQGLGTGFPNECSTTPHPEECELQSEALNQNMVFSNLAFWSFVGAGTVGLGTLLYAVVSSPSEPETRVQLTPLVGTSTMGFSVRGAF